MGVEVIEQVPAGLEKVDLVRRHQRLLGERIGLNELDDAAIDGRIIMPFAVDALYRDISQFEVFGPTRKDSHDP